MPNFIFSYADGTGAHTEVDDQMRIDGVLTSGSQGWTLWWRLLTSAFFISGGGSGAQEVALGNSIEPTIEFPVLSKFLHRSWTVAYRAHGKWRHPHSYRAIYNDSESKRCIVYLPFFKKLTLLLAARRPYHEPPRHHDLQCMSLDVSSPSFQKDQREHERRGDPWHAPFR